MISLEVAKEYLNHCATQNRTHWFNRIEEYKVVQIVIHPEISGDPQHPVFICESLHKKDGPYRCDCYLKTTKNHVHIDPKEFLIWNRQRQLDKVLD